MGNRIQKLKERVLDAGVRDKDNPKTAEPPEPNPTETAPAPAPEETKDSTTVAAVEDSTISAKADNEDEEDVEVMMRDGVWVKAEFRCLCLGKRIPWELHPDEGAGQSAASIDVCCGEFLWCACG